MRKTKVYRPRRSMRFSDDPSGARPVASFVGGPSLSRTRPTKAKINLALRKFDSIVISGSVMPAVRSAPDFTHPGQSPTTFLPVVMTSSISIQGSVSFGRLYERGKYNAVLMGRPAQNSVGAPPYSTVVVDSAGQLTGTFVSPSWTHSSIGSNQAFVGVVLSSSFVETKTLNHFLSGTQALETTAVPASGNLFYSKNTRFKTIVVKHTASFFDTVIPTTGTVPVSFSASVGVICTSVTGALVPAQANSINNPATIFMNVPVSGRLMDVKIWVDLAHLSSAAGGQTKPLAMLGISLQSPTVSWGHAHPEYNDLNFKIQSQFPGAFPTPYPNFYNSSFLLWEGNGQGPFAGMAFPGPDVGGVGGDGDGHGGFNSSHYPSWDKDHGMRTVFTDGSPTPNPRHLYSPTSPSGNFIGAPNKSELLNITASAAAYGINVPWISEDVGFDPNNPAPYTAAGSPPAGWRTGPGGSNDINEWPTTGVNYGASTLRPLYPLLDAIYMKKTLGTERGYDGGVVPVPPPTPDTWRGFRPGLRGTEISGTWKLMIVSSFNSDNTSANMAVIFRQARLEITYETPISAEPTRFRRSVVRHQPRRARFERYLFGISGSDASNVGTSAGTNLDYFRNDIYTLTPDDGEVGRTFGILLNSGSTTQDYALLYRLSGSLASISGNVPGWLLNNQFGMPMIPVSSASLVPPSVSASIVPSSALGTIFPRKVLDGARRLSDEANDVNPTRTLVQLAADFVSGSG